MPSNVSIWSPEMPTPDEFVKKVDLASTADGKGAAMVGFIQEGAGAVPRTMLDKARESVYIEDFGAVPGEDATDAVQRAVNAAPVVYAGPGTFYISETVKVPKGTWIIGAGGSRYVPPNRRTTFQATKSGMLLFDQDTDTGSAEDSGFSIWHTRLISDYCIRINDPDVYIISSGDNPHVLGASIKYNNLSPLTNHTGIGISLSKVFDSEICENQIHHFDTCILLNGCDINQVHHNRIAYFKTYGVLETSAQTYGSQNEIARNDILTPQSGATFIKSASIHPRIRDNYLEAVNPCKGFIDVSSVDIPIFGANVGQSVPNTLTVQDNRLDGHYLATDFVYRITPAIGNTLLKDMATSGPRATPDKYLVLTTNYLPAYFSVPNPTTPALSSRAYEIDMPFLGGRAPITRFVTQPLSRGNSIIIDAQSILLCRSVLHYNYASSHIGLSSEFIALFEGLTSTKTLYVNLPGANTWLSKDNTYTVKVTARAENAGQVLRVGTLVDEAATGAFASLTLTDQYQTFVVDSSFTPPDATKRIGIGIFRNTSPAISGEIYVQSIEIIPN